MKNLRNLFLALPLLTLVGCGCTDDSGVICGDNPPLNLGGRSIVIGANVPPIPVRAVQPKNRIDVFFLMDDSGTAAQANRLGFVHGRFPLEDPAVTTRTKQGTARGIFRDVYLKLKADLQAAFPGQPFDLAFGVGRYEDFGGSFRPGDTVSRPFILNQPIYREDRTGFAPLIDAALAREAPGVGSPLASALDPESIVEALFQIGSGAGFDGDGGGTTGSGLFGALDTAPANSQTAPGPSGDVPQALFGPDGNDEDGEPKFSTPGGMTASGPLGGVGWRPEALRYVITTSDWAGVSPFAAAPIPATITSTDGPGGYPRDPKAVLTPAFSSVASTGVDTRFGVAGSAPPVAPLGAAPVQASVNALNALNIEVLSIGTLRPGINPFKPNLPGATFPAVPANTNPSVPNAGPFTWMNAYAILTGADRPYPAATDPVLPLVYDLQTVSPLGLAVTNDVREDLVYRVGQGLSSLPGSGSPPTPDAVYQIVPTISTGEGSPFQIAAITPLDTDAGDPFITVVGSELRVQVSRYLSTNPPPHAPREYAFLVQLVLTDPNNLGPFSDTMPFSFTLVPVTAPNAGDASDPTSTARSGRVFVSGPAIPADASGDVQIALSAVVTTPTQGCVFVANDDGSGRTDSSGCAAVVTKP